MLKEENPFESKSGSVKLGSPMFYIPFFIVCLAAAMIIVKGGLVAGIGLIVLPFLFFYLNLLFRKPVVGIYTVAILGYLILGVLRYAEVPMIGTSIDSILVLTLLALFFQNFHKGMDWSPAKKDVTLLAAIWLGYGVLSAANPEIRNYSVWLSSLRTVSAYMLFVIVVTLLLINTNKRFYTFLYIWGIFSILATLKGMYQVFFGVDAWEKAWLDSGAYTTHLIFGKLRVFSFMSDAGQFGANQAYTGVVFLILSMGQKDTFKRIFFLIVGLLGIYGMFISGTRGAISVPLAGFVLYFILKKNKAVMISGFVFLAIVFVFFKYTTIGQDNQQIRRMRTAFDPNDASLQTRLANQRTLSVYLSTRPIGGGLGHAGKKVKKILPNTVLANIATDSWYVMIWAEQGVVGLVLHLIILFYIIIKASYLIMYRIRDPILKNNMSALAAGMLGIMVASYGNAVLGQVPTSIMIYVSMALMLDPMRFEPDVKIPELPAVLTEAGGK
ncbi:MAG: O-antigen ligase family protein [Bacteroidales bacterium]|nr:O-antigen ligase family protein [Bacteroidales bacterium]